MIRSMTGFGQGQQDVGEWRVTVEIRTVNHRFADVRVRLPAELSAAEATVRRRVLQRVRRGRVELVVRTEMRAAEGSPGLNREWVETALAVARELRERYDVGGELTVSDLIAHGALLRPDAVPFEPGDAERAALERALDAALDALDADRRREGESLARDLVERLAAMRGLAAEMDTVAAELPARSRERLLARLQSLQADVTLDPARVAQEAAFLVDRADVTEELVRLRGHLEQAGELVGAPDGEPLGKRLDFLLQEIHRETNTVNSKSSDLELTRAALAMKAEAEKVREQVQNVE